MHVFMYKGDSGTHNLFGFCMAFVCYKHIIIIVIMLIWQT